MSGWGPRVALWMLAATLTATLAHFVLGIPLQLWDSFGDMAGVLDISVGDTLRMLYTPGAAYYRPLRVVEMKTILDLSGGNYFVWYKGFHILLIAMCLGLFVALLRVRTSLDAAAGAFALAVLLGLHTFNGAVREMLPISTYLIVLVSCLAAANLSSSRGGWGSAVAAIGLLACAALSVESGLLVWVIVVAGFLVGLRGVSRRGVLAVTAACALYFVARFLLIGAAGPGLDERATGFGFRVVEASEMTALFGGRRLLLYAYNVLGNVSSLLFSEPRSGVFVFVDSLIERDIRAWRLINVATSVATTAIIVRYGVSRFRAWRQGDALQTIDRLALVAAAVVTANAVLGFPYSKDVIMGPAGLFYAVLAYASMRHLLDGWVTQPKATAAVVAMSGLLVLACAGWAVRVVGLHVSLRDQAMRVREDWATVDYELSAAERAALTPAGLVLKDDLRREALLSRPWPPPLLLPVPPTWLDRDY